MGFQVLPEEQAELVGQAVHRHVVDAGPTLVQVVGQQVPDRAAGQVIVVDQLPGGQLAADVRVEHPGPGRGARRQEARRVQQLVEVRSSVIAVSLGACTGFQQFEAVPDGDIAGHAALDGHDDGDLEHRPAGWR